MYLRPKRLTEALAPLRYLPVRAVPRPVWEYRWASSGDGPGITLTVELKGGGRHGEAIDAWAGVCVGSGWLSFKGLAEVELLQGLPHSADGRGYSLLTSDSAAREWEAAFADAGPRRAKEVLERRGAPLLQATHDARHSVERYLALMPQGPIGSEALDDLRAAAGPERSKQAADLAGAPGVLQQLGAEQVYEVAALLLVMHQSAIDPDLDLRLSGFVPMPGRGTMWRLQLLADRLRAGRS